MGLGTATDTPARVLFNERGETLAKPQLVLSFDRSIGTVNLVETYQGETRRPVLTPGRLPGDTRYLEVNLRGGSQGHYRLISDPEVIKNATAAFQRLREGGGFLQSSGLAENDQLYVEFVYPQDWEKLQAEVKSHPETVIKVSNFVDFSRPAGG